MRRNMFDVGVCAISHVCSYTIAMHQNYKPEKKIRFFLIAKTSEFQIKLKDTDVVKDKKKLISSIQHSQVLKFDKSMFPRTQTTISNQKYNV